MTNETQNQKGRKESFLVRGIRNSIESGGLKYIAVALILAGGMGGLYFLGTRDIDSEAQRAVQEYSQVHDVVFGENGLADLNRDGEVDMQELQRAYDEMGVPYKVILINPMRRLTSSDLTKYIDAHTTQTQRGATQ